ncbi:unnamed protein product [Darwinula stevensoni]|uniref:Trifunctional nucleotide phosphoesterase protein YfkN n=1 Tax=Darwinula stevensoni TaxID=69355 RepID=A0A7R9A6G6_9CRUS|nr:unnamed protein product [Darwinula stevensoni]CAG0894512.1 unnamed protein product [Darwinula stevensoni]
MPSWLRGTLSITVPRMGDYSAHRESITILHFNDVYNIEGFSDEPVGGASRFISALDSFSELSPLVLFSGDVLAPSLMSTYIKGEQMLPVLQAANVDCACFGNHDFDFGLETLVNFVERTNFPWLMSNVIDLETSKPLAGGHITHIIIHQGHKIGLMGLVEDTWLDTLATIDPEEVEYVDFVIRGQELAHYLKVEQGCEFVIALTHMRLPNDIRLLELAPSVDLVLGGHDHEPVIQELDGRYLVKSGTDFRNLSKITIRFDAFPFTMDVQTIEVTTAFPEDPDLQDALSKFIKMMDGKMDEVLGEVVSDLEGRFSYVRTQETNLGNFMTDIMLAAANADAALLNSGTLRADSVIRGGPFTWRDLSHILPMMDPLIVLECTALEGRFPQVSGVRFAFDPAKPAGQRVDPRFVVVGDQYLQMEQTYTLVTKEYLYSGRDGYGILQKCRVLSRFSYCRSIVPETMTAPNRNLHREIRSSSRGFLDVRRIVDTSRAYSSISVPKRPDRTPNRKKEIPAEVSPDVQIGRVVSLGLPGRQELLRSVMEPVANGKDFFLAVEGGLPLVTETLRTGCLKREAPIGSRLEEGRESCVVLVLSFLVTLASRKGLASVDAESSPELRTAVENHFRSVALLREGDRYPSRHRQSLVTLSRRHSLARRLSLQGPDTPSTPHLRRISSVDISQHTRTPPVDVMTEPAHFPVTPPSVFFRLGKPKLTRQPTIHELEEKASHLCPKVEGRIICIESQETRERLEKEREDYDRERNQNFLGPSRSKRILEDLDSHSEGED